jgi:hypothetical protein
MTTTATDDRFANLELDLPGSKPAIAPVEIPGVTIRERARAQANAETQLARARLGLKLDDKQLYFASGTKMLASGEAVAREYRRSWEQRPLVGEGMDALYQRVQSERRKDLVVPAHELLLDNQGRLTRGNGGALVPTGHAFRQLANGAPAELDAGLKANLNLWMPGVDPKRKVCLRTRNPNAETKTRELFAAVSPKYAAFDSDTLAQACKRLLPADARVTVEYDGARTQLDVSYANPYEVADEIAVGRLHRVGLRIDTADDGSRGFRIRLYAERIACINCTILADGRLTFSRRHIGNVDAFAKLVQEALSSTGNAIRDFGRLWGEANERAIHDAYDGTQLSASECFKRLITAEYVKVPHVKPGELHTALMTAWEQEPGDTAAAVNRAITRLAHEASGSWKSQWYQDDLETAAGELLYNQVYSLAPITDEQRAVFA